MSKPQKTELKLANVYHAYHDIEGEALIDHCILAGQAATNRIKMQINPKQLETVERGPMKSNRIEVKNYEIST